MAIDNAGTMYDGRIYVSWADAVTSSNAIYFAYSTNSGQAFTSPTIRSDGGFVNFSMPAIGPSGEVYLIWKKEIGTGYHVSQFRFRKSTDGGQTFGAAQSPPQFQVTHLNDFYGPLHVVNVPSLAVGPNGYVYLAFTDWENSSSTALRTKLTMSTDGGSTWSGPTIVPGPASGHQFFPWLTIHPSGRIAIAFMHSVDWVNVDAYFSLSHDNGVAFTAPIRVSTVTSDAQENFCCPPEIGSCPSGTSCSAHEYMGLALTSSRVIPIWTGFKGAGSTSSEVADIYSAVISINPASPWSNNVYLYGNPSYSGLTVNDGTVKKFDPTGTSSMLTVTGAMNAVGTSTSPIVFRSARAMPLKGDWYSINLLGGPNTMKYSNVSDAIYGVYVRNTNSANLLENSTITNCSGYGLYTYLTLNQANAVQLKDCAIKNNVYGLTAVNSRVNISATNETDLSKGVFNNDKYGVVQYTGGKLYLARTRIYGNGSINNSQGIYISGSGAFTVFSPDGVAAGNNHVYGNQGGQISITSTAPGGSTLLGNGVNAGFNHLSGNNYFVNNGSTQTVMAENNYFGSPPCIPQSSNFNGPLDYNPYKTCTFIFPSNSPSGAFRDESPFYNTAVLSNDIMLLNEKIGMLDFENAILQADIILKQTPDDFIKYFALLQKTHASIGKGDLSLAERTYFQLLSTGLNHGDGELVLLGEAIALERRIRSPLTARLSAATRGSEKADVETIGYGLDQNMPNPFNPITIIGYKIPVSEHVNLTVYDLLGQSVSVLVDQVESAGYKLVRFSSDNLP